MPAIIARLVELSPSERLQLEGWLAEFEEAWDEGRLAALVERLPPPGHPLRLPTLIELVKIDLERNWQRGHRLGIADYLPRYPELGPAGALPPDLLLAEEEARQQFGDQVPTLQAAAAEATPPTLPRRDPPHTAGGVPHMRGYEVLGKLGEGGMGAVYKARHLRLNRVVALKVVGDAAHARPADLVRFRQEAEMIARLQHPNIVQIYEVGEDAGRAYLALEYVDGPTLDRQVSGTPQPPRQAAGLIEALARAVHYAHGQGVLHRDLTPRNVLLTADGTPKITDFGLARRIEGESGLTTAGAIMGTPNYMAPEQAEGRLKDLGPHTDVWGLGALLYEMLTGRPPFQGATVLATLEQVRTQDPVPPHRLLGSKSGACPADLETICLKCLHKQPARRYASAAALADDLARYREGKPIQARPAGLPERGFKWVRRRPAAAAALGVSGLAALALLIGGLVWNTQLKTERDDKERQAEIAKGAERDAKEKLWGSYLLQSRSNRRSPSAGRRFDGLDALDRALALGPFLTFTDTHVRQMRDEAIACLALPDLKRVRQWEERPESGFAVAFDAALERYAHSYGAGNISLRQVEDDRELRLLQAPGPCEVRHFSPDGRFLAGAAYPDNQPPQCLLWDLHDPERAGGTVLKRAAAGQALAFPRYSEALAFSPDSHVLACGGADGSIHLYETATGRAVKHVGQGLRPHQLAFHPSGRRLAITSVPGQSVQVLDLDDGTIRHSWKLNGAMRGVAWRGDGRLLAAGCSDHNIHVWDMAARPPQLLSVLEGHQNDVIALRFAGDLLISTSWDGTTRVWDPVDGRQLVQADGDCWGLSRDGRQMILLEDSHRAYGLWQMAGRSECRILHHGLVGNRTSREGWVYTVDFSPDGRLLASTAMDGVRLWDVARGREVAHLPVGMASGCFHPEGAAYLVHCRTGLQRWPIRPAGAAGGLQAGPPEALGPPLYDAKIPPCWSGDGRRLAFIDKRKERAVVVDVERPAQRVELGRQPGVIQVALSHDGRWAATVVRESGNAQVWDAATGELQREIPGGATTFAFTADGQWLVTCGGPEGCRFWRVGSWEPGPSPGAGWPMALTKDGTLLAVGGGLGIIRLLSVPGGEEVARLEMPSQTGTFWLCFNPEGSLLAVATSSHAVQLWDLSALRRQLKARGFDADRLPNPPPANDKAEGAVPVKVFLGSLPPFHLTDSEELQRALEGYTHDLEADPADARAYYHRGLTYERLEQCREAVADFSEALKILPGDAKLYEARGRNYFRLGQHRHATADWQKALDLDPKRTSACNELAWTYVAGPAALRDPEKALPLARKAVENNPGAGAYQNTLGVVYYRLGQYQLAAEHLNESISLKRGEADAFDLFFLAMTYHQLGDAAKAHDCYDRALRWQAQAKLVPNAVEELNAFGAEANALLARRANP